MALKDLSYRSGNILMAGKYAVPESQTAPCVLVVHDWSGRNSFAENAALRLAEEGYVGLAIDVYGEGRCGKTQEEKASLMTPLIENRDELQRRLLAAVESAGGIPQVDQRKIAVLGFCFGGLCALDLARTEEAPVQCAISFHGLLEAPPTLKTEAISASVLALHGHDDPMVSPSAVQAFQQEMTNRKADWQLVTYGSTSHAFTNPEANDPGFGTVYQERSARRAWQAALLFLAESFSGGDG